MRPICAATLEGENALLHELKIWPEPYRAVRLGTKRFELRRDDRGFEAGDKLLLREWNPETETYTGRALTVGVYFILRDAEAFGLHPDFCAMSIAFESEEIG